MLGMDLFLKPLQKILSSFDVRVAKGGRVTGREGSIDSLLGVRKAPSSARPLAFSVTVVMLLPSKLSFSTTLSLPQR